MSLKLTTVGIALKKKMQEDLKSKCLFLLFDFVSDEIKESLKKEDVKSPLKKASTAAASGVIDLEVDEKEGEDPIQELMKWSSRQSPEFQLQVKVRIEIVLVSDVADIS